MTKLTDKEAKFIQEYLIDLNASAAARRAGYSEKSANRIGFQNLSKVHIQEALTAARQELSAATGVTPQKVIQGFADIAFSDLADCYDENGHLKSIHDMPPAARQALAGIEVDELFEGVGQDRERIGVTRKIKRWDKVRALESLGKHFGIFDADKSNKLENSLTELLQRIDGRGIPTPGD